MAPKPSLKLVLDKLEQQDEVRSLQTQLLEQKLTEIKDKEAEHHKAVNRRLDGYQKTIFHEKTGAWAQITANTAFIGTLSKAFWVIIPVLLGSGIMLIIEFVSFAFSFAKAATGGGP